MKIGIAVHTDSWVTEEAEDSNEPYVERGATDGSITGVEAFADSTGDTFGSLRRKVK